MKEAEEEYIELLEAREDSAEAFEPTQESLDLIAFLVQGAVVLPGVDAVGLGRNHRDHAETEHQLPGFIAFISPIHQHGQAFRHRPELCQQSASFRRVVGVAGREGEGYRRSCIRGNQRTLVFHPPRDLPMA